jgi:hypothetical protein
MVCAGAYFLEQHAANLMPGLRYEEPGNWDDVQLVLRLVGLPLGADLDTGADWPKPLWHGPRA